MNNDLYAPYTDPALAQAQTGYENAANTATQYQSAAALLPDALKTAINEKLDYNKDLINEKNTSMVDYFNAPTQARVQYQDIFNPFQREALVQQATNNAYLPFATNQDILKMRLGSIQDIIGAATGAFNAKVSASQNAAQIAKDRLAYLFQLAGAKSDAAYKSASLAIDAQKANSSGTGGLDFLFKMAGLYKPTAQQEKNAADAQTALDNINAVKAIRASNPQAFINSQIPILKNFGDAAVVDKYLRNIRDVITRVRTGAALNSDEEAFYKDFIVNPLQAVLNNQKGTDAAFSILESIFNKSIQATQNPYLKVLDQFGGVTGGTTTNNSDPLGLGI